ncbi:MAG: chemotaxis protein CheX [Oligoflexia bacterium]|nr:chemotaxis protein CheX [Oligoflexia bacterium]
MSLFQIQEGPPFTVLKCPAHFDASATHELLERLKDWLRHPVKLYVLDFTEVTQLDLVAYRAFTLFHQALKKHGAYTATINLSPALAAQVKAGGIESVLSPKASLDEALESAGLRAERPSAELDLELLTPFSQAIKNTIEIQANTRVTLGAPRLKMSNERFEMDVAGVISLTSAKYNGSIALCLPAKVFLQIYSNMVGEKHLEITRETEDAAGELLNMIFGQAKAELNNNKAYEIQRAIPTIVRGQQLHVHHLSRGVTIVIPAQTEAGEFRVEVSVEPV